MRGFGARRSTSTQEAVISVKHGRGWSVKILIFKMIADSVMYLIPMIS